SRRRHTRFSRDWSSDVCSSDLAQRLEASPLEVVIGCLGGGVEVAQKESVDIVYPVEVERKPQPKPAVKRVLTDLEVRCAIIAREDRKSTRLNSSHVKISYAVFC